MWYVKMYMNTGFNLINVPDSPSLLEQKTSKKFGVIDCLQRYFLPSITIRATEDQVIHGDFLKLYDDEDDSKYAYYVINSYTMTSGDTVVLDITMEPLLTCGGVANIDIVDGMVSRHHLSQHEEEWNEIPMEDDPLLVPTQVFIKPVAYYADGLPEHIFEGFGGATYDLFIRSMVSEQALIDISNATPESLFADMTVQGINFNYDDNTSRYHGVFNSGMGLKLNDDWSSTPETGRNLTAIYAKQREFNSSYTALATVGTQHIADGAHYIEANFDGTPGDPNARNYTLDRIARLIEYGRNDYILDAYYVPDKIVEYAGIGNIIIDDPMYIVPNYETVYGDMITILDDDEFRIMDPAKQGYVLEPGKAGVHNKRILFGKHHSFNFVSPDNNQVVTVNPEDIFCGWPTLDPEEPIDHAAVYPRMKFSVDMRPGGNMIFKILRPTMAGYFPTGMENSLTPIVISTGTWDTANIAVLASPGKDLKMAEYALSSSLKDASVDVEGSFGIENKVRGLRALNPIAQIKASINRDYYGGSRSWELFGKNSGIDYMQGGLGDIATAKAGAMNGNEYDKARYDRLAARQQEDMQFAHSVIPQPQVISKASGSNLMTGHGLVVYRNKVSGEDLKRFDTIINKYGCKHTTALTKDMLTHRPLFNYIETNGVSIKCSTVPKSVRDDLANALNTGIRIWHTANVDINAWNDYAEEES